MADKKYVWPVDFFINQADESKNEYQTLVMSNVILVSVIVHCVEFTELFIGPQHRSLG